VYAHIVVAPEVDNVPVLPHGTAAEAIAAGPTAATHPLANPTTTKDRNPVDRHPRTRIASPLSAHGMCMTPATYENPVHRPTPQNELP
jgi:hypothetical protein